jgi:hypothetical protein
MIPSQNQNQFAPLTLIYGIYLASERTCVGWWKCNVDASFGRLKCNIDASFFEASGSAG